MRGDPFTGARIGARVGQAVGPVINACFYASVLALTVLAPFWPTLLLLGICMAAKKVLTHLLVVLMSPNLRAAVQAATIANVRDDLGGPVDIKEARLQHLIICHGSLLEVVEGLPNSAEILDQFVELANSQGANIYVPPTEVK